jgi:cystathionine gamma-synthase
VDLADWLSRHPAVAEVWHPSLTTRDAYDAVRRKQGGYGGLISFVLKNPKKTPKAYDALRLCKGPSFGTPFSLVCAYPMLAHYQELDWAEDCGVPRHLLRISCGLEPISKLTAVLEEALAI